MNAESTRHIPQRGSTQFNRGSRRPKNGSSDLVRIVLSRNMLRTIELSK